MLQPGAFLRTAAACALLKVTLAFGLLGSHSFRGCGAEPCFDRRTKLPWKPTKAQCQMLSDGVQATEKVSLGINGALCRGAYSAGGQLQRAKRDRGRCCRRVYWPVHPSRPQMPAPAKRARAHRRRTLRSCCGAAHCSWAGWADCPGPANTGQCLSGMLSLGVAAS